MAKRGSGLSEEGEPWLARESSKQSRRTRGRYESRTTPLPAGLLEKVDAAAKALGLSRTDLVCAALSDFLIRHSSSEETRQLNRSYIKHPPKPDPFLGNLVLEGMRRMEQEE